jgi:hypothetical protein
MYFAQMYCYGKDPTVAGITGFQSCIGAVYVGKADLFAVHIPNTGSKLNGAARFASFITANDAKLGALGFLNVFTNGDQRGHGIVVEAKLLKENLGHPYTTLYRLKDIETATVYVQRQAANSTNVKLYVKNDRTIQWVDGGASRSACYDDKFSSSFSDPKKPATLDGFTEITGANCEIIHIP